ncbi:MAG TPA: oligosaccharide flippase family protein, partial [Pirellulales bacterium]|nr:oligosaccharide flippase family protein [Pirellulales bacterium]
MMGNLAASAMVAPTLRGGDLRSPLATANPATECRGYSKGLAAMLDQAVVSAASFITSVFVGRFCGEEALGLYSLGFTLLILVRGIQESLVLTPYTILSPRLSNRRHASYAGSVLVHSGLAALISMLMVGLGAVAFSAVVGLPRLAPVLGMLAAMLPLLLLRDLARRFLFADLNLHRALLLDLTVAACQLALIAWLSAAGWLSAVTAHTAAGLACGVAAVAWLLRSRHGLRIQRRRILGDWVRNWSLSRWIFAEHLCGITNAYSPHWLLALLLGAAATGEFAAAMTVVLLLNPFIIGLGNLLGPATARAYANGGVSEMRRIVQ